MVEVFATAWDWLKAHPEVCLAAIVVLALGLAALDRWAGER